MSAPSANAIPLMTTPRRAGDIAASRLRALSCRGINIPICDDAQGLCPQQCRVGATAFKSLLLSTVAAGGYSSWRLEQMSTLLPPIALGGIVVVMAATLFVCARVGWALSSDMSTDRAQKRYARIATATIP